MILEINRRLVRLDNFRATFKYFVNEISSDKRSFACAQAIFASRFALKSPAWRCVNFITIYLAVLNFLLLFGSSQKVSAESLGNYKNIEQKLSSGQLALAQSLIAAFSPTTNIENNYKTFYTLQRAYLQNQDLTMLQNIQLLLLAYQCPFTDGQVVYNARALYNLVNQTAIVYNDFNCNALGFSFGRTASDSVKLSNDDESILMQLEVLEKQSVEKFKPFEKYTLYPNPATNYVTIVSNTNTENVHIQITDVNGKILISGAKAILNFETSLQLNLISGIYFVNITNDNGNKEVKKLVIVK